MANKGKVRNSKNAVSAWDEPSPVRLDPSYARAASIKLRQGPINIWMIGCGGTGSYLAEAVAQLWVATDGMKRTPTPLKHLYLVDPDVVEYKNVGRQRFCHADIGKSKAVTLAERCALTFGLRAFAIPERFNPGLVNSVHSGKYNWGRDTQDILLGCVDNAAARRNLSETITQYERGNSIWWLNCGNWARSGELLIGSTNSIECVRKGFPSRRGGICTALPSPAWIEPGILQPQPEESADSNLSCAEIALRNVQSATINRCVAAYAADMLLQLLLGQLKYFSLYFSLGPGTSHARYITRENISASIRMSAEEVFGRVKARDDS